MVPLSLANATTPASTLKATSVARRAWGQKERLSAARRRALVPSLVDQDGHSFDRDAMEGKLWVTPLVLTHRRSTCPKLIARLKTVQLMTHNAKGEVVDAYTSWEWSTLCDEISKLEVDLHPTKLAVLPLAKRETPETAPVSGQLFAGTDL